MMITQIFFFFCMPTVIIYLLTCYIQRKNKLNYNPFLQSKLLKCSSLPCKLDDSQNATLVLHVEEGLLKSFSIFPYFMMVAFEAGGVLRAIVVLLLYPFVCLLSKEIKVKILVFLCFFGLKADKLRVGRTVLPKFFLDDVGHQVYNEVMSYKRIVAVSDLPRIMIEVFLKDHLGIDLVIGRELKVVHGYFVGLLMDEKENTNYALINEVRGQGKLKAIVGFNSPTSSFAQQLLFACEEIYMVKAAEKREWSVLPKDKYHKRLIFHDGRLAFKPTFYNTSIMFLWVPFGFCLCILRILVAFTLPYKLSVPILAFIGIKIRVSNNSASELVEATSGGGTLYVCNHRTLLDSVHISLALMRSVTIVTYGVSRVSELISPIKTAPLTRNREHDLRKMKEILCKGGDLVVCPEGTTCTEPYLLRFSPLFAQVSDNIVPVALDMHATMFYGTTATGLKCLDPFFCLLNPSVLYTLRFLERLPKPCTCSAGKSNVQVAQHVQREIAKALGFECTNISRKDKYMMLAGNGGIV